MRLRVRKIAEAGAGARPGYEVSMEGTNGGSNGGYAAFARPLPFARPLRLRFAAMATRRLACFRSGISGALGAAIGLSAAFGSVASLARAKRLPAISRRRATMR